jgi:hypothetical protein
LTGFERSAFSDGGDDEVRSVVRAAVTLRWLLAHLGDAGEELMKLGVDPETAFTAWVDELDERLAAVAQDLLAADRFEEARPIAEARARLAQVERRRAQVVSPRSDTRGWLHRLRGALLGRR